jgi:hypothetical protein
MTPDISEIEKVPGGILITFEDGRSAIYSTALLYDLLPNDRPVEGDLDPGEVSRVLLEGPKYRSPYSIRIR